jgi:hypothetical protein
LMEQQLIFSEFKKPANNLQNKSGKIWFHSILPLIYSLRYTPLEFLSIKSEEDGKWRVVIINSLYGL